MTINEKRHLSNYIKGLVRESIEEIDMPKWWNDQYGVNDEDFDDEEGFDSEMYDEPDKHDEFWYEHDYPESRRSKYEGPDVESDDDPVYADEPDDDEPAGLNELRQLAESYARESVARILSEKKGGWGKKKGKKGEKKKETKKISSSEKTIMDRLNSDEVNAAHYYYKLYGAKTDAEKAAARSLGYKKAKAKKLPGNGKGKKSKGVYRFDSKERNKLNAMLSTDKN